MDQPNTPDRPDSVKPDVNQATAPVGEAPAPAPPMSATAWLFNNGLYILILVGLGWLVWRGGFDWVLRAGMVVVGLGFIIFIHELGHFLAAKWCDVHVQTFSIGFGPALPGCSFTRGETTYKLAAIPLGGYVNMVGEGPEADEDESYPRSFKNKPVLQRMLIISAGVIMNLLFGALAFIVVYLWMGEERPTSVVYRTEPGSPAWVAGVRPGWRISEIDGKKEPYFDDVKIDIALASDKQPITFEFKTRPGVPSPPEERIDIEPLRDKNNMLRIVGIGPANRLQLLPPETKRAIARPVRYSSAAASARALALEPGDVPTACTDPEKDDKVTALPEGAAGWRALGERLRVAKGDPFTVRVRTKQGKEKDVESGPLAFDFGDTILATTDPATADEPYNLKDLPLYPEPPDEHAAPDPFEFRRRLVALAGKPIVLRVARHKKSMEAVKGKPVVADVLVPPSYHVTFGLRMRMGKVAAVRAPASGAGLKADSRLKVDDIIHEVALRYGKKGEWQPLHGDPSALDPVRLPHDLYQRVHADPKREPNNWQVKLTVLRRAPDHRAQAKAELDPIDWDDSWRPGDETPISPNSPMSIAQLGIAYRVDSTVTHVARGSPADRARFKDADGRETQIQAGDEIREIRFREAGRPGSNDELTWSRWQKLKSARNKEEVYDQWAHVFWLLQAYVDYPTVEVEVYRANAKVGVVELTAEPDTSWPLFDRGVALTLDTRVQLASSFVQAIGMGLDKTWRTTRTIYLSLLRLISRDVDHKTVGGPIAIAQGAFSAAQDIPAFILLLGLISINLAVVNFLPIPVLDGGHMVFLVWEWVRGKPPPETVRVIATYVGLLIILGLMLFVFYNDFERMNWIPWKWK